MLLRIFYILILLSCIQNSIAQTNLESIAVSLNTDGKNFKQVIQQLENTHEISFSYSDNILPTYKLPERSFSNIKILNFLDVFFVPHGIDYEIINNNVVLFRKENSNPLFDISGFIEEIGTLKHLIGATIFVKQNLVGSITNNYGFYSLKLAAGYYTIQIRCLGYHSIEREVYIWNSERYDFKLKSKSYEVNEVLVNSIEKNELLESTIQSLVRMDIMSLKELPGLFGENDALRNLSLIPGIQSNEMSTGSIYVRGGSTEQTTFLMDEATIYNPSHFGGFFSVFNPDVVNNVSVYKSELPSSESGALSSIIDVQLREGDFNNWKVKGGIGLISARASVEGPIIKDKASVLLAFRRTFVDRIAKYVSDDEATQQLRFYFYDANLKFNYHINSKNRLFVSGYSGSDSFNRFSGVKRTNNLGSIRWNHIYGNKLFSNTSMVYSNNNYEQVLYQNNEEINWNSRIDNVKFKIDFSQYLNSLAKLHYGFSSNFYRTIPYSYTTIIEKTVYQTIEASNEQMLVNSFYLTQDANIQDVFGLGFGLRASYLMNSPFNNGDNVFSTFLFEPSIHFNLIVDEQTRFKGSYNHREQPMHQLYINMLGIAVNRWMPASTEFKPQKSDNFSIGLFRNEPFNLKYSVEAYYRKMSNLIETLQETRILYTDTPEEFLYKSEGSVKGIEFSITYETEKAKAMMAYDYNDVLWTTAGINNNEPYPASHTRKHNFSVSGVYKIGTRLTASATWRLSSGLPFTRATGKYVVDGRVYLKYDEENINTGKLPNYHRLDLSLDIEGKNNYKRRWKSYWNFSVYNAYFRKNVLGVVYFSELTEGDETVQQLDPNYFYLYQFVPSISYRFSF